MLILVIWVRGVVNGETPSSWISGLTMDDGAKWSLDAFQSSGLSKGSIENTPLSCFTAALESADLRAGRLWN